jgi:hypothetical protein
MSIRVVVGILYLLTGLLGLYWSIQLTLTGMYGTPFSWWYAVVAVGALTLILGAVLVWASGRAWTEWVPLIGSVVLASYFIPATIVIIHRYVQGQAPGGAELAIRLFLVLLVLLSLGTAASDKFHLRTP